MVLTNVSLSIWFINRISYSNNWAILFFNSILSFNTLGSMNFLPVTAKPPCHKHKQSHWFYLKPKIRQLELTPIKVYPNSTLILSNNSIYFCYFQITKFICSYIGIPKYQFSTISKNILYSINYFGDMVDDPHPYLSYKTILSYRTLIFVIDNQNIKRNSLSLPGLQHGWGKGGGVTRYIISILSLIPSKLLHLLKTFSREII